MFLRRVFIIISLRVNGKHKLTGREVATASPTGSGDEAHQRPIRSRSISGGTSLCLPRTCRVNCGCEYKVRAPHMWGEAGATQSLRKAFSCSVEPSCVHNRERPRDSSMSVQLGPAHLSVYSCTLSSQRDMFSHKKAQTFRKGYVRSPSCV